MEIRRVAGERKRSRNLLKNQVHSDQQFWEQNRLRTSGVVDVKYEVNH